MTTQTAIALNQLNNDFYSSVHESFHETRGFFWEGWTQLLPTLQDQVKNNTLSILDVGCGNGRFGLFLNQHFPSTTQIQYQGVDANIELLAKAEESLSTTKLHVSLNRIDFVTQLLQNQNSPLGSSQETINCACFGVLHHIPSYELRLAFIKKLLDQAGKDRVVLLSLWQFTRAQRLADKLITGSDASKQFDLEENDYLMRWDRTVSAVRYCHLTTIVELRKLVSEAGGVIVTMLEADGREKNLNLYAVIRH